MPQLKKYRCIKPWLEYKIGDTEMWNNETTPEDCDPEYWELIEALPGNPQNTKNTQIPVKVSGEGDHPHICTYADENSHCCVCGESTSSLPHVIDEPLQESKEKYRELYVFYLESTIRLEEKNLQLKQQIKELEDKLQKAEKELKARIEIYDNWSTEKINERVDKLFKEAFNQP